LAAAATTTEPGVVSAAELSVMVTVVPPAGAACEMVTVQVALAFEPRLAGAHCRAVTVVSAVKETEVLCEDPFRLAEIVTPWAAETAPAVAVKLALLAPAATATEAGTLSRAELDPSCTVVTAAAAPLIVTLQAACAPEANAGGLHVIPVTVSAGAGGVAGGGALTTMPPATGDIVTAAPPAEAPITLLSPIARVPLAVCAIETATVATTPLPIAFSLGPLSTHS